MEEERRLFYVALTRAKKKLYLSRCLSRKQRMQAVEAGPSPFLEELPLNLIAQVDVAQEAKSEEELKKDVLARMKAMFARTEG